MPSPQPITWEESTCRQSRQPQLIRTYESLIFIVFLLRGKHTQGYDSSGRIILAIKASGEAKYDYVGEHQALVLNSDTLRLKFDGFREFIMSPVAVE